MTLNLNDLMKKAKAKGINQTESLSSIPMLNRPWQQESTLFNHNNVTKIKKRENNQITTGEQPENNEGTNQITTREQPDNNEGTNQITTREQPDNEPDNGPDNKKIQFLVANLVGLQKNIFNYVLEICLSREGCNTGSISTHDIAKTVNSSYDSAKVTLARLIKKGLINRLKGKGCRGGFIILEISRTVKLIALQIKKDNFTLNKPDNERDNKPDNNLLYSSSNNKITTTDSEKINIEPLSKIGFTLTHLQQIANQNKLDTEMIQNSIYAFSFDLENNNRAKLIKGDPLNYFMGILKNGNPYAPPSNYESEEDKSMRLYLEKTKEVEKRREMMEIETMELDFKTWDSSLNEEDKNKILPEDIQKQRMSSVKLAYRRKYHRENIWPTKKNKIITNTDL